MTSQRPQYGIGAKSILRLLMMLLIGVALATAPAPALAKHKEVKKDKKAKEEARKEEKRRKEELRRLEELRRREEKRLREAAKFETKYMKKMIDRHAHAIQLAMDVTTDTTSTEILNYALDFVERESVEMATLQNWLVEWYKISYAPKVKPIEHDDDDDGDDELEDDEDESFEVEFLDRLIGYLHFEIAHSKQVRKKGLHQDLKDFAKEQIVTNRAEIELLKGWLEVLNTDDDDNDNDDD